MTTIDYYKAPAQEVFDDIKKNAIKIWKTYDNTYGYVDEKVGRIEPMQNISDNAWTIVAMFDSDNQAKLLIAVKPATRKILTQLLRENGYL
jgi:hypothetical protein